MNREKNISLCVTVCMFLALLSSSCTSPGDLETTWVGRDAGELIAAWGQPDATATLEDGSKIMTWESYDRPNQVVPCRQSFTVSTDGTVEKFTSSNCSTKPSTPVYRPRPAGTIR